MLHQFFAIIYKTTNRIIKYSYRTDGEQSGPMESRVFVVLEVFDDRSMFSTITSGLKGDKLLGTKRIELNEFVTNDSHFISWCVV